MPEENCNSIVPCGLAAVFMPFRPLYRNFSKNYYIYNLDLKF
jgi:hypothetical protein